MSKIVAHKMIASLAVEMVQAAYEELAANNAFYELMPDRNVFVKEWAPKFIPRARATLTSMLDSNAVSDTEKSQIFEALYLDQTLPRGRNVAIQ